jgi:putative two-component system response regulator
MKDFPSQKILVVDDDPAICKLVARWLQNDGYRYATADSGPAALQALAGSSFDLMITDINMPAMTGIELLKKAKNKYADLAAIMATAVDDRNIATHALELGAYGYIIKPLNKNETLINVANALRLRDHEIQNKVYSQEMERLVLERTEELRRKEAEVRHTQEETIRCLARAAEFRDDDTAQHTVRMSYYCKLLAEKAGLSPKECELIFSASPLHDVGKIGTPDTILLKPDRLTEHEFAIIKNHAEIGYRILADAESEMLKMAALIAWTHHEKYDGSGYPKGLAGSAIPIAGRIAAICDVFDALTFDRVYKKAYSVDKAVEIILQGKGTHFDPKLVELFLASLDEILEIKARFIE